MGTTRGGITIKVYSGEGPIPHLHFIIDENHQGCLQLEKAEYFNHDASRNPTGFSPWEECKQLKIIPQKLLVSLKIGCIYLVNNRGAIHWSGLIYGSDDYSKDSDKA